MTVAAARWSLHHRGIGAIAGFGPAALILGYYLVTGGPIQAGLLTIVTAAVMAGWLIGPRVRHTSRADLLALVAYLIVGYLLHSAIDVVIAIWDAASNVARDSPSVLEAIGVRAVVTVIYFPVWAVFLSPLALVWMQTVRVIHGRLRPWPGAAWIRA